MRGVFACRNRGELRGGSLEASPPSVSNENKFIDSCLPEMTKDGQSDPDLNKINKN